MMDGRGLLVDFRPIGKLRGAKPVDVTAALGPVIDALIEDLVDLSRVRVVCDWVQHRNSFREVVDVRPILATGDTGPVLPQTGLDLSQIAPGVSGETLRLLVESGADIWMQVNNGAVASLVDALPLLHPHGRLICHDLFVTDVHAYRTGFCGPGKYDGSVVSWLNGPLPAHIGRRKGFDVAYERFVHQTGANIVTMTAQVRD